MWGSSPPVLYECYALIGGLHYRESFSGTGTSSLRLGIRPSLPCYHCCRHRRQRFPRRIGCANMLLKSEGMLPALPTSTAEQLDASNLFITYRPTCCRPTTSPLRSSLKWGRPSSQCPHIDARHRCRDQRQNPHRSTRQTLRQGRPPGLVLRDRTLTRSGTSIRDATSQCGT